MAANLLIVGAGGYLGRYLIPILARGKKFSITAISSQANLKWPKGVKSICAYIEDIPIELAETNDLILNLASAGVAHKEESDKNILLRNLEIAYCVSNLARFTRLRFLLHFGSDTEYANLAAYLQGAEGLSVPTILVQQPTSLYSLSKTFQSSLIRHLTSQLGIYSQVIMTPNVYGGIEQPHSLMGAMRRAIEEKERFMLNNPDASKRFVHIDAFSHYVIAVLHDILSREGVFDEALRFAVSSMDFVPKTTVGVFAKNHWLLLGGKIADLGFLSQHLAD